MATPCAHIFQVSTWTASDDKWTSALLKSDDLCPWSPARAETDRSDQEAVVVYANAEEVKNCETCKWNFCSTFEMPTFWWQGHTKRSNGYFGCESRRDDEGLLTGYNTWCHFIVKMLEDKDSYAWAKLNIFTQWRARTRQTAILVFDLNKNYKVGLSFETSAFYGPGQRQQGTREKHSPLWPYTRILDEVAALQNKSVWDIRTLVRKIEKAREVKESRVEEEELLKGEGERYKWKQKPAIDYPGLHDLSRHAIHVCETLDVSTHTTRTILEHHVRFMDEQQQLLRQGPATGATNGDEAKARRVTSGAVRNVHETLQHMGHMVESLRHRSSSNKARLLNEIQLCYHMASDYDSGTSVQIAAATRSDSADMRTVAYLTLTFLPATFISALFGSSFFSFEQSTGTWAMSPKFWIYWATTVPATAATVAVWYVWKNRSLPPALSRRATGFEGGAVVSLKVKMRELMKRIDSDKMKEEV